MQRLRLHSAASAARLVCYETLVLFAIPYEGLQVITECFPTQVCKHVFELASTWKASRRLSSAAACESSVQLSSCRIAAHSSRRLTSALLLLRTQLILLITAGCVS